MTTDSANDPVLSFQNVRIGFDEGDILTGLTFSVAARETKVLIGESGTGKTLALKLAAGLLQAGSGAVHVLGRDLGAMSELELLDFRRQIGFVFQEGALFTSMSVADNVSYRLREEGIDDEEIDRRVRESLRFVEMEDAIDKFPSELSGGMVRRVSIARAVVSRPHVVLYDSPTAGLDPVTAQTIITLILRLRDTQGVTSLLATQRLQDAFGLANYRFDSGKGRVIPAPHTGNGSIGSVAATNFVVLRGGKAYFEGDPQALADSKDEYLRRFLV